MSRVGKNPVPVPGNVEITLSAFEVSVKGPLVSDISVEHDGGKLVVKAANDSKQANAMSGTMRALLANMVKGVTDGFERKLILVGVGYRAQAAGDVLNLTLGFSHPVAYKMPEGVRAETPSQTEVVIKGIDKQQVGQVAAEIRAYRPPADEVIVMKETKKK